MKDEQGTAYRVPRHLDRTARLLGTDGIRTLKQSRVTVFGLGGVGSYAVEGLARSGVGHLKLVDFDEVCITNINRQIQAVHGAVGKSKAVLLADRARQIDPDIDVEPVREFYSEATSAHLLEGYVDLVIDAIDNVTAKIHLIATCVARGIPIVSSMGASAKLDPTRVRGGPLDKTRHDKLARVVRKFLRKHYDMQQADMSKVWAIYSDEEITWPNAGYRSALCGVDCVCPSGDNKPHSCEARNIIHGSVAFVTGVFGLAAAGAAVRMLLGRVPPSLESP